MVVSLRSLLSQDDLGRLLHVSFENHNPFGKLLSCLLFKTNFTWQPIVTFAKS